MIIAIIAGLVPHLASPPSVAHAVLGFQQCAWSSDAKHLAVTIVDGSKPFAYLIDLKTHKHSALDFVSEQSSYPSWSPNGKWIVYNGGDAKHQHLFITSPLAASRKQVTFGEESQWCPTWSPDGKLIAFTSRVDKISQVFVCAPDGSNTRQLTRSDTHNFNPVWTPDSRALIYESPRLKDDKDKLYRLDIRTGREDRIDASQDHLAFPTCNPDGKEVLCSHTGSQTWSIARVSLNDGSLRDFIPKSTYAAYSPKGDQIAVLSYKDSLHDVRGQRQWHLYLFDRAGKERERLW